MDEHAHQRAALALAAIGAAPGRFLHQAGLLQDEARPGVGEPEPVALDRVLPEMPDREAAVLALVELTEPGDGLEADPPPPRPLAPLIADAIPPLPLEALLEPPHVPRRDAQDVGGQSRCFCASQDHFFGHGRSRHPAHRGR